MTTVSLERKRAIHEELDRGEKWIAHRLREARLERGLPQNVLAREIGVTRAAYSYYEDPNGHRIDFCKLAKLAHFLGVPLEEFSIYHQPRQRTELTELQEQYLKLAPRDRERVLDLVHRLGEVAGGPRSHRPSDEVAERPPSPLRPLPQTRRRA